MISAPPLPTTSVLDTHKLRRLRGGCKLSVVVALSSSESTSQSSTLQLMSSCFSFGGSPSCSSR